MKTFVNLSYAGIFWLWNMTFLLVVYIGILPFIAIPLTQAAFAGEIEPEFLISILGIVGTPTICTLVGCIWARNRPLELLRLFYGIEAPLFLLFCARSFLLRELTPASHLILGTILACVAAFSIELLWGYLGQPTKSDSSIPALSHSLGVVQIAPTNPKTKSWRTQSNSLFLQLPSPVRRKTKQILPWVQVAAHTLMLFVGVYVGALLLFYAIPVAAWLLKAFFSFEWIESFWWQLTHYFWQELWYIPVLTILFAGSATLFLGMPSMLAGLYIHSGQRILRAFSSQYGKMRITQATLSILTTWLVLYLAFQNQPQIKAFKLLENPPQTEGQRQELLAQSDEIRKGLLNAYLSPYRYLGTWEQSNQIRILYRSEFNLPEPMLQGIQNTYNSLVSPFLYRGDRKDDQKASQLYEQFFDTPIQKGERQAVLQALKSTAILDDAKAGVLNINQKKVWLKQQALTVQERGDWADIEIHETYNNQTFDVEEILYSFSLPESAVITGVWLGDTADLNQRFPFKVSPRGAAQKVYNSQVNRPRAVDPALLEQVGPRQYRLRAFPVPPKVRTWERREGNIERPTEMHLWLTYKVMRSEKGWELPNLGEKRNIFWTNQTQRLRNGKPVQGFEDNWLEASVPASKAANPNLRSSPLTPQQHQINLNGYQITAKPLTEKDYILPQNQRFAIVLDTSRSMGAHRQKLTETFDWLKKQGFTDHLFANNDADLYITAPTGIQPQRLDNLRQFNPQKATFYGTLQLKEMLHQFVQLQGETRYDGILMVTDEGSYELSQDKGEVAKISVPLWVVHLDALAPAYDDGILKAIQDSGGGVSWDLSEVLRRIATTQRLTESSVQDLNVNVVDGYAWWVKKVDNERTNEALQAVNSQSTPSNIQWVSFNAQQPKNEEGFAPLAARVLVRALSGKTDGKQVEQLDAIHAIAKTQAIVTPYSSMIVLVNDEQRKLLEQAEASSDRFERKVEDGKEQLNQPNNPLNAATVPEPETIVGLSAIAVFLAANRKRVRREPD
jgi:putative PEP-CTERM system integral membrane protein